jgi:uncharacterized protein YecT (DUF1311 family)
MISFSKIGTTSTIALMAITVGCSYYLSQGRLFKTTKLATSLNLATEPAQATLTNSSPAKTCLNSNQVQTNDCSQLAVKSTQHLEEVYQQLVSQLGGASREKLINSQLAWTTFVEAQCGFETRGFNDSTSSSSVRNSCLDGMTQQRIQDLQRYLFNQ